MGIEVKSKGQFTDTVSAALKIDQKQIRVRWEGNGSSRYDGRVQDVEVRFVEKEDTATLEEGSTVCVCLKKGARTWTAVVVNLSPAQTALSPDREAATK